MKRTTQVFASLLQDIDLSPTDQVQNSLSLACICAIKRPAEGSRVSARVACDPLIGGCAVLCQPQPPQAVCCRFARSVDASNLDHP